MGDAVNDSACVAEGPTGMDEDAAEPELSASAVESMTVRFFMDTVVVSTVAVCSRQQYRQYTRHSHY